MTERPALPCPKCQRTLIDLSWHDDNHGSCWSCKTDFEFVPFPALTTSRARLVPKDVLEAEHATCFYHSENQAETVCESCGRFLCTVCAIDFGGRRVCPACIATIKTKDATTASNRTLYGGIALSLVVLPVIFWPLTLVTAPAALGVVIYGWRKPTSLVGGGRAKMVVAGLLALAEIGGWAFLFLSMWTAK